MASYFDRIQFDPRLRETWFGKYLVNVRVVFLVIIGIMVVGAINYLTIPRRLNPEIQIAIVTVTTIFPGASPEDVEALITVPLEDKLKSLEGLDEISSTSRDSVSAIVLQFTASQDPDEARSRAQEAVSELTDLPEDAQTPRVTLLDFENRPVLTFVLSSADIPGLMTISERLSERLERIASIARVDRSGFEEQLIEVRLDPSALAQYGVTPGGLSGQIRAGAASFPAGSVRTERSQFGLSISKQLTTIDAIRDIPIDVSRGAPVPLGTIAQIREVSGTDVKKTWFTREDTSLRGVQFFVYKTASSNIDKAAVDAVHEIETFLAPYENTISYTEITNTGTQIAEQFDELVSEFGNTILLISITLFVFLGLKQAAIASVTVPLTMLASIAISNAFGMSLNFLTLFSFLIALGLLIDDTIVIVTAMTRYYASGKFSPAEAGQLVWRDFFTPLWSTTATTIWSFLPLLLATGIIGEFIKPIPIVITATMISSTGIALIVTLPLMIIFSKLHIPRRVRILLWALLAVMVILAIQRVSPAPGGTMLIILLAGVMVFILRKNAGVYRNKLRDAISSQKHIARYVFNKNIWRGLRHGFVNLEGVSAVYQRVLRSLVRSTSARKNIIAFIVVFSVISYALVPLGFVRNEFFPKTDEDLFYVTGELPPGTTLRQTEGVARRAAELVSRLGIAKYLTTESGFGLSGTGNRQEDTASFIITVALPAAEDRAKSSLEIAQEVRDAMQTFTDAKITVTELSGGPPAGADVQVSILGDDLGILEGYAQKIVSYLETVPGVSNAESSLKSGTSQLSFIPDAQSLAAEGISRTTLGTYLRTYTSGFTLDTIRFNEERDVVLRLAADIPQPEDLNQLMIPGQGGQVPLGALGEFVLTPNPVSISREDTLRSITVTAAITGDATTAEVNRELLSFIETLDLPEGYRTQTGGVNEENQRSVNSIIQAMALSFLLILVTMVLEFKSFRQSILVMLTIPLAVSGVFYLFALTRTPLSFPALIGVLALFGIVVKNAIVIIDKINANIREEMSLEDSIVEGSASRLEPVVLTSLTTIFGLLPITLSDPLWRGLGGAIMSGLLFSGIIMLFFIPVMYAIAYGKKSDD